MGTTVADDSDRNQLDQGLVETAVAKPAHRHSLLTLDTRQLRELGSQTFANWGQDNVPRLAAAFSFYAMLSLAPVLVLAVVAGSILLGKTNAETQVMNAVKGYVGPEGLSVVKELLKQVANTNASTWAGILSLLVTLYGASNLFMQLEQTANQIWGVVSKGPFIRGLIIGRLVAFLMVVVFAVLALAWLALDSWLGWISRFGDSEILLRLLSVTASALFLTLVFGAAYRALPKGMVAWSDVWLGATIAGVGVTLSRFLLSFYFAYAGVAAAYGAAGALVVILLWIYYTSQIFFFGFEVTYTYAHMFGSRAGREQKSTQYS